MSRLKVRIKEYKLWLDRIYGPYVILRQDDHMDSLTPGRSSDVMMTTMSTKATMKPTSTHQSLLAVLSPNGLLPIYLLDLEQVP